jgi:hypothetical protein
MLKNNQSLSLYQIRIPLFILNLNLWRKPEYREKTTDLLQKSVTTLSNKIALSTPRHERDSNSQF